MKLNVVKLFALITAATAFVGCTPSTGQTSMPSSGKTQLTQGAILTASATTYDNVFSGVNPSIVWDKLHYVSKSKLAQWQHKTQDPVENAWLELASIAKQKSATTQKLANDLINWREKYAEHPANTLFPDNAALTLMQEIKAPHQIAILLPQTGAFGTSGQIIREGFLNALYADGAKAMQQNIKFYDTAATNDITGLYKKAIADGADFIVGPLLKNHVQQLYTANAFSVPTLALNYTVGSLPTNLYEFGLLPEDEAAQLADRAAQNGKSHALVIAPQNEWGKRLASAFAERWTSAGGIIQDSWYYTPKAHPKFNDEIAALLKITPESDKSSMEDDDGKSMLSEQRRQER